MTIETMLLAADQALKARRFRHLDRDDARQEALLACIKAAPRLLPTGNALSFFRMAANWALIQFSKAEQKAPKAAELVEVTAPAVERSDVYALLRKLSPQFRSVLIARYTQGLSQAQVAAERGCSKWDVSVLEGKALRELRRLMS